MKRDRQGINIICLPNYFKIIGLAVIILSLITGFVLMKNQTIMNIETYKVFNKNCFLLGLAFVALAKDREEDELSNLIKIRTMAAMFVSSIVYVIFNPLFDLLFNYPIKEPTAYDIMSFVLLSYIFLYGFLKKFR